MKKTRFFRFGQLRQERGDKHVRMGDLVAATNVCQTSKGGVYQKRKGFDMTSLAFSGATWGSATVSSCVPAQSGSGAMMRDSQDRVWSYDGATSSPTWAYKGTHKRAWVDTKIVDSHGYTNPMPVVVDVGDNLWIFARKENSYSLASSLDGYYLTVVKKSNGDTVYQSSSALLADNIINAAACYDGTYVWFFWIDGTTSVRTRKFTASTPSTAPASYTFTTAGVNIQSIACYNCAGASTVLVAYGGNNGTTARLYHASLNKTTGAAVSPQSVVNATCGLPMQGLGFFQNQTSSTVAYYHYYGYQNGGSGATYAGPAVVSVTVSTLAYTVSNGPDGAAVGSTTDAVTASGICGIDVTGSGNLFDFVIFCRKNGFARMMQVLNGVILLGGSFPATGVLTTNIFLHGWWLASTLVKLNGYVYWLTGHDDVACSALPTGTALLNDLYSTQRVYNVHCLKETDFFGSWQNSSTFASKIVGQFLSGQAAAQFHGRTSTVMASTSPAFNTCRVPLLVSSGSNLVGVVASKIGSIDAAELSYVQIDTSHTWGKETYADGRAVAPGSIPVVWSRSDSMHEISPLVAPSYISVYSSGTGTDYVSAAAVYVIRDSDGKLWRSAPYVLSATFGTGAVLYIPTLLNIFPTTKAFIEIYIGTTASPKLQTTVENPFDIEATGARLCYEYTTPVAASYVSTGETLYTVGGSLSNAWPPPCQAAGVWGQRLLLAGKNILWASQEFSDFGFLFSEFTRSTWAECLGDINAICPIDSTYCAVIGKPGVGVISGPGPDGRGSGNYSIKTLSTEIGIVAGGVSMSGDGGCYFQDFNTGRPVCATSQGQVLECAGGARDLYGETVTAILCQESERQIHFHTNSNHVIVLDYQHKTESAPFGQVYVWVPTVVAYASAKDAVGPFYVGSNGAVYRLGSTSRDTNAAGVATDYRMVVKSAQLQMEDMQGEFDVSRVQVLGKFNASFGAVVTTYPDYATSGTATAEESITASPVQLATKPPNCMRIQSLQVQFAETSGTGAACDFEGFAVEYLNRGKLKHLNTSQTVT